jgi:threonine synthase
MQNQNNPGEHQSGDESKAYNLMDGATGEGLKVIRELEEQRKISANSGMPLDERLEAYEDIFDSEVGDTSLVRARNIEREVGLRQIYMKFEGGNPTGTQKDRIAFAQAMDALRRGFDSITMATCGNYGVAMALAASFAGLQCRICIPENYHTNRIKEMTELGAEIVRVAGDYEKAVAVSQELAQKNELYDANPGGENTVTQMRAYGPVFTGVS